jgi:hypothetical protein
MHYSHSDKSGWWVLIVLIPADDAEAAKISGNFCCALGGHHLL